MDEDTLEAMANHFALVNELGEGLEAWEWDALTPAQIVRLNYVSSDCVDFARALHALLGYPVASVVSPAYGFVHALVEAPDGRLLDAAGWQSPKSLARRYGRGVRVARVSDPERLFTKSCGDPEDDTFGPGIDAALRRAVQAARQFPWEPFSDAPFAARIRAARIPGADRAFAGVRSQSGDPESVPVAP